MCHVAPVCDQIWNIFIFFKILVTYNFKLSLESSNVIELLIYNKIHSFLTIFWIDHSHFANKAKTFFPSSSIRNISSDVKIAIKIGRIQNLENLQKKI